jgi:HEPN domain-containing protein
MKGEKGDRDVALAWLRKADSDLANAELCLAAEKALDTACFHCQQAAEKSLKAYLIAKNVQFPLTHDLKRLLDHCSRIDPTFGPLTESTLELNPFAVVTRYDDAFWPEAEEVQAALESARKIRRFVQERFPF